MTLAQQAVAALRLQNALKVDEDVGWELWTYRLRDPASQTELSQELFLLFIKSRGVNKESDLSVLNNRVRVKVRTSKLSVAIQRSNPLASNRDLVKTTLRADSVKLLSELLQQECQYLLGSSHTQADPYPYFIEPIVDDGPALTKLGRWLISHHEDVVQTPTEDGEPSVAVLLAPAGLGKTSLARELARFLRLRPQLGVLPLLVESSQWTTLNPMAELSAWSLIKHAFEFGGHNAISQDAFELFAKAGWIVTIFDGLDEVGLVRAGTITPVDVVRQLRTMAEKSDGRVLFTSRDGLWSEMVPTEYRQHVREFRLRPFSKEQIGKYREKRFPNPRKPERQRFDDILKAIKAAAHPKGTSQTEREERALAAPLILDLAGTEAEEFSDGAVAYGLQATEYKQPLYAITFGILNREHVVRHLPLTPAQQFMMISTLVVDMGLGPYSLQDVRTAAEYASGTSLPDGDEIALKSHPLLRPSGASSFVFRFEYLVNFAPAVWLCKYALTNAQDSIVERYLSSIAGKSSPVAAYVAELLSQTDWKSHLAANTKRIKLGGEAQRAVIPFLWEVAQSIVPGPGNIARAARTSTMCGMFGTNEGNKMVFSNLMFAGPITYMDFKGVLFRDCNFQNCEWINCELDSTTEFKNCSFKGRFASVQSSGLRNAFYNPLIADNVDSEAQGEFEKLLGKGPITITLETVTRMLIALLRPFYGSGFFIPRTREQLGISFIGAVSVREYTIDQLVECKVLEEYEGRGLQVVKKQSPSVLALLDNAVLKGAVGSVANKVADHFKALK